MDIKKLKEAAEKAFPVSAPYFAGREFREQATPAAVLELIASHERLREACGVLAQVGYTQNGNLHDDINEILDRAKAALAAAEAA